MPSVGYPCKKSHIQNNSHHSGYQRSQTDHGQARVGLNTHNVSKWQTYQQSLNKSLGHDSHYMPRRPSSQFGSGTDGIQVMNIRRRYSIRQWRQQIPCPFCLITGIKHFFQCFSSHNKKLSILFFFTTILSIFPNGPALHPVSFPLVQNADGSND